MIKLELLAKHFNNLGLNIFHTCNELSENNFKSSNILKHPYSNVSHLYTKKQKIDELNLIDWEKIIGIGAIVGFENLRVIDIDGCTNLEFIEDILDLLGLPKKYEWLIKSGSHDGYHIYIYCDKRDYAKDYNITSFQPNRNNIGLFEKFEFLWENTHAILPSSIHYSSLNYSFVNTNLPMNKPLIINSEKLELIEGLFLDCITMANCDDDYGTSYKEYFSKLTKNDSEKTILNENKNNLIFVLDFETDGLIKNDIYPNAIQVSWQIMDENGKIIKKQTELINSNFNINSDVFKINRINPEIIIKLGKPISEVLQNIYYDLIHCSAICAHNLNFDLAILKNEFKKNHIDFDFDKIKKICTMQWGYEKLKTTENTNPKFPKLTEIYKILFDFEINQMHNSQSDVSILSKCLRELLLRKDIELWK